MSAKEFKPAPVIADRTAAPPATAGQGATAPPATAEQAAAAQQVAAAQQAAAAIAGLYRSDSASKALGMEIVACGAGTATVRMAVREDMLNGHRVCHGGLVFALADSAFAFACNSHGDSALAAAAAIDFLKPAQAGDTLTATAVETWRAGRSGLTEVCVTNQAGERVALFRGRSAVVRK